MSQTHTERIDGQACIAFVGRTADRFAAFHKAHPNVYVEFIRRARIVFITGQKIGARTIWEAMRWSCVVERDEQEQWKLNDHYLPYYARLAMKQEPDLAGFFDTRKIRQ